MNVTTLKKETFDSTINTGITLVDFWAPWCMPCKAMLPILDKVASTNKDSASITVGKVNVDEEAELANQFAVSSIPTLILFKDGKLIERVVGMQSAKNLLDMIKAAESE